MRKYGMSPEQARQIREQKGIEETKLQTARVKKGLSQKQLSVVSGVTLRAIQCYEQRTRSIDNAHIETLCDLCLALDCRLEDLIESKTVIDKLRMTK